MTLKTVCDKREISDLVDQYPESKSMPKPIPIQKQIEVIEKDIQLILKKLLIIKKQLKSNL